MAAGPGHIGIFLGARRAAHAEAANELLTVTAISTIPFVIGLFSFVLIRVSGAETGDLIAEYLSTVFLRGQLFLIAVSYLANSLHRLFTADGSYRRPDIIVIFSLILFGVIGIFYGINPSFAAIKGDFTRNLSLIFLTLSVVFYYYTAVLSYERPLSVEETLEKDSNALSSRLAARRLGSGDPE